MSNKPKKPDYQKPYISKPNYQHERFSRMYASVLYNPAYKRMNHSSKNLYTYMLNVACGGIEFTFPKSAYTAAGFDAKTFRRAKSELIQNGFIEEIHSTATAPNRYKFSKLWQSTTPPKETEQDYYLKDGVKMHQA